MKSLLTFIPTHILVLYSIGVLLQYYMPVKLDMSIVGCLSVISLVALRFNRLYAWFFCLLIIVLGMFSMKQRKIEVGKSVTEDQLLRFEINEVLKENNYSRSYIASQVNSGSINSKEQILVKIKIDSFNGCLEIGDQLLSYGTFELIPKNPNPYGFDYRNYMAQRNIFRQVFLGGSSWRKLDDFEFSLKRVAMQLRVSLIASLKRKIKDKDVLSVSTALLLGERKYIDSELQKRYANAGVIHILAVSGLHIGIILMILNVLFSPLKYFKHGTLLQFILIVSFLWFYAFLAGLSASIVRAVTMFSFVAFGLILKQRSNIYHSVVTSALVLVLVNPFYLFDLGFKMSYIAVLSIVILYPIIAGFWKPRNRLVAYFWNLSAVSISAQIGLLPISLYYFHQFPGLFIVSNLVVLPFLGVILMVGFIVLILSYLEIDYQICYQLYSDLIKTLNRFIQFISNQEDWLFDELHFSQLMLMTAYVVLFFLIRLFFKLSLKRIYSFGFTLLILQLVLFYELYQRSARTELIVYHKYKNSIISIDDKSRLQFYGVVKTSKDKVIENYINETGATLDTSMSIIPPVLSFGNHTILVIDKLGVYNIPNLKNASLLLKSSPKINLERCINYLNPKIIIADGSNYPYLKKRWKQTCLNLNVEFYDTSESGAYILKK